MTSRHHYPHSTNRPVSGTRTFAFYALLLLGLAIAFLMFANGAKTWFASPALRTRPQTQRNMAQRDAAQRERAGRQRSQSGSFQVPPTGDLQRNALQRRNDLPTEQAMTADSIVSEPRRSMVSGHVTHELPNSVPSSSSASDPANRFQLTMPPEFADEFGASHHPDQRPASRQLATDRSVPSGDFHVRDRDWRKTFQPAPPLEPAVARASLTEIRPYQEWDVHKTASDSLGRIGVAAVPQLIRALSDPDPKRRAEAAYLIGRIGPDASSAVDALVVALSDSESSVKKSAARALGQIGPDAAKAVNALMRVIQETEPIGVTGEPPGYVPSQDVQ